jgi:hypothetical protein
MTPFMCFVIFVGKNRSPRWPSGDIRQRYGSRKTQLQKKNKKMKLRVAKGTAFLFSCPDIAEIDLIPGDIAL